MQQQSNQAQAPRPSFLTVLTVLIKIASPLRRQIKGDTTHQEDESFVQTLKTVGVPEEHIPEFQALIATSREASKNRKESYKSDKIFVGGIGVLNLVLLQVLGSVGRPDIASSLSWLAFSISLPCAAGFLYMSRLQDRNENYGYGTIHEKLAFVSVMAGAISATALVYHFWPVAGIILFIASLLIYVICALFRVFTDDDFFKAFSALLETIVTNPPDVS